MSKRKKRLLKLTDAEIESGKSARGGFTRKQLEAWGVHWPPPHGWRKALLTGTPIPEPNHPKKCRTRSPQPPGDPHVLLRQVVMAVINAGHASDLYEFPDVIEYFTTRRNVAQPEDPDIHDLAEYHGIPPV